jgi:hypothetical protein
MRISYKIYVNGQLHADFYSQEKFKAEAIKLEAIHGQLFNQPGGFLASNVKTR